MTIYSIKSLFFIVLFLIQFAALGQNFPSFRWEPTISLTKKFNAKWSSNFTVRARQRLNDYGESTSNFKTDRWDLIGTATYAFFGGKKLSLGYLYRSINPFEAESGFEHRFFQQFAFITNINGFRIGNKLLIEERIRSFDYMTRIRYGIGTDFPLQGEELDPWEAYLITGNELVFAFNRSMVLLENRFTLGIGWLLEDGQKFQIAAESRFNDLISASRNHIIQIKSIYYFNF